MAVNTRTSQDATPATPTDRLAAQPQPAVWQPGSDWQRPLMQIRHLPHGVPSARRSEAHPTRGSQ